MNIYIVLISTYLSEFVMLSTIVSPIEGFDESSELVTARNIVSSSFEEYVKAIEQLKKRAIYNDGWRIMNVLNNKSLENYHIKFDTIHVTSFPSEDVFKYDDDFMLKCQTNDGRIEIEYALGNYSFQGGLTVGSEEYYKFDFKLNGISAKIVYKNLLKYAEVTIKIKYFNMQLETCTGGNPDRSTSDIISQEFLSALTSIAYQEFINFTQTRNSRSRVQELEKCVNPSEPFVEIYNKTVIGTRIRTRNADRDDDLVDFGVNSLTINGPLVWETMELKCYGKSNGWQFRINVCNLTGVVEWWSKVLENKTDSVTNFTIEKFKFDGVLNDTESKISSINMDIQLPFGVKAGNKNCTVGEFPFDELLHDEIKRIISNNFLKYDMEAGNTVDEDELA